MLVLTRKLNERIAIGDNVKITVVGIRGNHVRIGIEAPPEVTILRDELRRHNAPGDVEVDAEIAVESTASKTPTRRPRLTALVSGNAT